MSIRILVVRAISARALASPPRVRSRRLERQKVQPGSVTFIQRFGSVLNANTHFHFIVIAGVFLDRTAQGLKPRCIKVDSPSDADIADVVQKTSCRVVRTL
jgi:hypothetical protein